jgi:RNA polymerase sigma-70 factor (ECF subfamily)
MDNTSFSLLARVRHSGDGPSWDHLVQLYQPLLRRWLRTYDVQDADSDDLIQEVLATVVRELPNFDHNQRAGAFRTWLRGILVNRLRHFWRARQGKPAGAGGTSALERLNELADEQSDASRLWAAEHDREIIARLMELIQPSFLPKTWEAFHRQLFGGQRADQVATELEMPLSSVYVARHRVLSALRREAAGLIDLP